MRVTVAPSAKAHGITEDEIRAVISFYALTATLAARKPGAQLALFIGPAAANEPWIEVIADLIAPNTAEVFHAMMLRPSTVTALGALADLIDPQYARQRR